MPSVPHHPCDDEIQIRSHEELSEYVRDNDRLASMFEQQRAFMKLLQERRSFPAFPLDLSLKAGQQEVKGVIHEMMDELHEAIRELKNSKSHRATELAWSREKFVEELSDALHYFFEVLLFAGITTDEIFDAYIAKGRKNVSRIEGSY